MNPRRGFLALVGGSLLSGSIVSRASAAAPTLILPPKLDLGPAGFDLSRYPILAGHQSEMHAILHIKGAVPPDDFQCWLSVGLHMARGSAERRA